MGAIYDDLEDHEGYAERRLPDDSLTASWTAATVEFSGYIAACACGWHGAEYPPTADGASAALDEWDEIHAQPLLAKAVPSELRDMIREVKRSLSRLAEERPLAGVTAVQEFVCWAEATLARVQGAQRAAVSHRSHGGKGRRLGR